MAQSQPAALIDTDILIDLLRGVPDASRFLTVQRQLGPLHTSIICAMELITGCGNSRDLRIVQLLISGFTVDSLEPPVSVLAHELLERYFLSHRLAIADALIAASAMHRGMTLISKNVRDFQFIPGLVAVRPY